VSLVSSEKVNWSSLNFIATFRKYFDPENDRISHKSLPKSEKMHVFEALWLYVTMALWLYGTMAIWHYGSMARWHYGSMALWLYGSMALWHYGKTNVNV
jgi:hypothetical protein